MLLCVSGVAAPFLPDLSGPAYRAEAANKTNEANRNNTEYTNPNCKGCQICTIFYSNSLALNNRHCWCETARSG